MPKLDYFSQRTSINISISRAARYSLVLGAALCLAATAPQLYAQTPTSTVLSPKHTENLQIIIRERGSGALIPGVLVSVNGQNKAVTDAQGRCTIPYSPGAHLELGLAHISYVKVKGYRVDTSKISDHSLTIYLKESVEVLSNVVVTAQRRESTPLQQSTTISRQVLERSTGKTLGSLLEKVPGVSTITTGNTISKPVIQGMHSSRILLVNNGIRLESQSWGADHAPEIDHTGSAIIEVVKGAEAIRYGYGAMGGVVLFNDAPLPYGSDRVTSSGHVNMGYASNTRGYDGSASLTMGYKRVGLRLHGMYQRAGDYSTAEYTLNNTGINNISLSALAGFDYKQFSATLGANVYYARSGIYYASKVSDIDQLLARFRAGRPDEATFAPFSYHIRPPFQQSQHFTLRGDLTWRMTPLHKLNLKLSYQDNLRQEFEDRKNEQFSWLPVQDLQLTTYGSDLLYHGHWSLLGMETQIGVSSLYQWNYNVPGTKQPAFIPNYTALTLGSYWIQKAKLGPLQIALGLRYDIRAIDVNGYTNLRSFKYYEDFKMYKNFSSSLALHYQLSEQIDIRTNIGYAWRPPDVNELYATGLHHGTYWVEGNRSLKAERGIKAVLGARYRSEWFSIEPSLFYQYVDNYIYDNIGEGLDRFHNHPSGKFPKFVYGQDRVRLYGGDLTATAQPLKGLEVGLKGEWMYARNLSQDTWLPFIPSDRYTLSGSYEWSWGDRGRWSSALGLEGLYVTKQQRFDPTKDLVPESPDAYLLLNATAELRYKIKQDQALKILLSGDNVLNSLYKEYTDRFRYYAHAMGANISLRIIYNF